VETCGSRGWRWELACVVGGGVFENVARMVRGGDLTVCSAVLLSMRHVVVVVVPSSAWFIFLTPGWGRAELMLSRSLSPHTLVNN
jgi:hypothetical protein